MANKILTKCLKENTNLIWNNWVRENNITNHKIEIKNFRFDDSHILENYNFENVTFNNCKFIRINCSNTIFYKSKFINGCKFEGKRLKESKYFKHSIFRNCNFEFAKFYDSKFKSVLLEYCILSDCYMESTDFIDVDFYGSSLLFTKMIGGKLIECKIFGANVWEIELKGIKQDSLIIENYRDNKEQKYNKDYRDKIKKLKVYDLEIAHLINLLTNNKKFTNVFHASKSRYVLILGNFGRMKSLERIKSAVQKTGNLSPILFNWKKDKNDSLNFVETILLVAGLSKFIIVDITSPKSVPAELQAILSNLMIPVIPLMKRTQSKNGDVLDKPYALFNVTNNFTWVKEVITYDNIEQVVDDEAIFKKAVIKPAEEIAKRIQTIKAQEPKQKYIGDY